MKMKENRKKIMRMKVNMKKKTIILAILWIIISTTNIDSKEYKIFLEILEMILVKINKNFLY